MNKLLSAISLAILTSCTAQQELSSVSPILTNNRVKTIDLDKAEMKDSLYFSNHFKKPRVIALEATENSIIQNIRSIELFNDYIYILDDESNALYVFDLDGRFTRRIGYRGNGHGEYFSIYDFSIDRKSKMIYLWDDPIHKAHKYDLQTGKYIASVEIQGMGSQTSSMQYYKGKLYIDKMSHSNDEDKYSINEVDAETGKLIARYMESDRYNSGFNYPSMLQNSFFYSKNSAKPKFIGMFSDTIVELTPKGIQPIYAIKSKRFVSNRDLEYLPDNADMVDYLEMDRKLNDQKIIYRISSYVDLDNKMSLEFFEGMRRHYLVYDMKTGKAVKSPFFINDYISTENVIPTRLCYSDRKAAVAVLETPYMELFIKQIVAKGKIRKDIDQYDKIIQLEGTSNPVLFYHEFK